MVKHTDRYVPANINGGWGVASFILFLAVICIVTATYIHRKTYRHPSDVTWRAVGEGKMMSGPAPAPASPTP
jgi:hypothetical protein